LHNNNNISGFNSWELISFTVESVLLVVGCSLVDFSFENFLLLNYLFTIASLALVLLINDLALTAAVIAGASRLTVHAGTEHHHFVYHTTTAAGTTLLHGSILSTLAFALTADTLAVHGNLGSLACVDFLESHF
jgi:hypothetical protein